MRRAAVVCCLKQKHLQLFPVKRRQVELLRSAAARNPSRSNVRFPTLGINPHSGRSRLLPASGALETVCAIIKGKRVLLQGHTRNKSGIRVSGRIHDLYNLHVMLHQRTR